MPATVERLEYDPNRTAFIALLKYQDGELAYIIAPQRLKAGDAVVAGRARRHQAGQRDAAGRIPVGTIIHNVEMKPGAGGKIARSAGTFAQLVGKDAGYAQVKLMSGEVRMVRAECMAAIGAVSNPDNIEPADRQGRPHALAGPPAAQPRRGDEPGRPPAWRRRGPHLAAAVIRSRPGASRPRAAKTRNNKRTDRLIVRRRNATKG